MRIEVFEIIKKELRQFFLDKKAVLTVLMPGIVIYVMYSILGLGFSVQSKTEDYKYQIACTGDFYGLSDLENSGQINIINIMDTDISDEKSLIRNRQIDLIIEIPDDFEEYIQNQGYYQSENVPNIKIYYNSASDKSVEAHTFIVSYFENYENSIVNIFNINEEADEAYDLAEEKDTIAELLSTLLPMIIMTFVFSGCSGIASESIAGEKERGTLATVLVTPIRRESVAVGKVVGLSMIGFISCISSVAGMWFSLPSLMNSVLVDSTININMYGMKEYIMLLLVVITVTILIVAGLAIISALARSVKEAGMMTMPLMVIIIIGSACAMLYNSPTNLISLMIPFYNCAVCMQEMIV